MNFIFTLINPGCFVTIEQKNTIISEGFYAHVDDFKSSEDYGLFQANKRASIHIFIDLREQYYYLEQLPLMHSWKKRKTLQLKCQTENPRLQTTHFRKESENTYLFTNLTLSENHLDWIQFLAGSGHPLNLPRLVPLEIETFLHHKDFVNPPEKPCLIVVYYEELVGLRQLVFIDKKITASRLVSISEKNIKSQIALETEDLISYLMVEKGVDPTTVGFVLLGNASLFSKLPPMPQTIVDWSRLHKTSVKKGLPFNLWSMVSLFLLKQKPRLSLKLSCLEPSLIEKRRRFVFMVGGFVCLWMILLGGFITKKYQKILTKKVHHLEEVTKKLQDENSFDLFSLSSKDQSIAHGYSHLKSATPHPFNLLDETQGWLQDHWELKHIEWSYHSPKFKKESWVLDPPVHTEETLDLWIDYLGPDSSQHQAREGQIKQPLKHYKVMKNPRIKEIEVIRILKEGVDL